MPEFFVNKAKRGRKSAKGYCKALDKPIVVASTSVVTPVSSPDTQPKAKKTKKQLSPVMPIDNSSQAKTSTKAKKNKTSTKAKPNGFAPRK